jgi:RNA polymerase sigma factor (sigma-70 family)
MAQGRDAEVYEKHAEELLRFATVLVGPDNAPDVLSGAVLKAYGSRAWPLVENRRAYLFRCVANEARTHARRVRSREAAEMRAETPRITTSPQLPDVDIVRALGRLSPRQRAVVYLGYWEDLDQRAIADLLGISCGAVHRHLARARSNLRRMLHV